MNFDGMDNGSPYSLPGPGDCKAMGRTRNLMPSISIVTDPTSL